MALTEPQTPAAPAEDKLFTLSEISQRTGISMPTLQRYKKMYQDRLPSVGTGRKQRYPERALPVFAQLRTENASKRGRPRKDASAAGRTAAPAARTARRGKPGRRPRVARGTTRRAAGAAARRGRPAAGARRARAAKAARAGRPAARRGRPPGRPARAAAAPARRRRAQSGRTARAGRIAAGRGRGKAVARRGKTEGLLTLTEISRTTGISYPTLVRYVRLYSDRLAHEGKGRARRFYREAVDVFRSLRQMSGRGGRRPGRRGPGRPPGPSAGKARRGRPRKAAAKTTRGRVEAVLARRVRDLEKFQRAVEKRLTGLVKGLQKLR